jgi:hypothetical protein
MLLGLWLGLFKWWVFFKWISANSQVPISIFIFDRIISINSFWGLGGVVAQEWKNIISYS